MFRKFTNSKRFIIKNHRREIVLISNRIIIAMLLATLLMAGLIARLYYLQISQHNYYTTLSRNNRIDLVPIEPKRGLIYDRNGKVIAENIPSFNLVVTPAHIKDINATIKSLQEIIALSPTAIEEFHKQRQQRRRFEQIPLKLRLTEQEVATFAVNQWRFPGMQIKPQLLRHYPEGDSLAHVLGFVGRINAKELKIIDQTNYSVTNYIGKSGIEKFYEDTLHGKVGYEEVEIDAGGRPIRNISTTLPIAGKNLYLSIDTNLQQQVQRSMGKQRGAVVAIEPSSGEVLAFYSNPSFDPNLFVTGIDVKRYQALQQSDSHPLYNRALYGQYPLASTIKPFLGLAGLDAGLITPSYQIYDTGGYLIEGSNRIYRDWKQSGHAWVDISKAITESCDTFFYALAHRFGIKHISRYLANFGFGNYTGIDLPGEAKGLVPTPEWKQSKRKTPWYTGDTVLTGIGQGFLLTTPIQLASATAILANRGQRIKPHLVRAAKLADNPPQPYRPATQTPLLLKESAWPVIIDAMQKVISDPHGTGRRFGHYARYSVAAKTGTAQVISRLENQESLYRTDLPQRLRDHGLFIAFAPVEQPKIALAIITEHNEAAAATLARQIFDAYLLPKPHIAKYQQSKETTV